MKASELMQALADAGAPMEAILIAVRALEEKDAELGRKRAIERDRKRRQRAKEQDTDGTVTGQSRDTDGTVTDTPSLSLPPNENNSNPPTHTHPDVTTRARKADPFPRPDWCSEQIWNDLKANRKAKRLPNTASAHAKLLRDLEAMSDDDWPPGRLLEAIVARGWAAAYDPRENRNDRPPNFSRTAKPDPLLAMRAIARAQIEAEDSGGYPGDGFGAGPTLRALGSG